MTTVFLLIRLVRSQNSKFLLEKAKKLTIRELARKTPDSIGAKLLIASTASCVPTEIDILGHLCDVVKHGSLCADCFDPISFECAYFEKRLVTISDHRYSAENPFRALTEFSLGHRQRKTLHWPDAELDNVPGVTRNPCFVSVLSLMKTVIPWKTKINQEEGFVSIGDTIFQARVEGPTHHQYEDILRYVQKAPGDIHWLIDRTEFDELIAMKKDSAPSPDGIPYGAFRCARRTGLPVPFQRL